jgi:hypothetical protein
MEGYAYLTKINQPIPQDKQLQEIKKMLPTEKWEQ